MPWNADERQGWLFPPVSGVVDDIDLANLDPADPGHRKILIRAEHPELEDALREGISEIVLHGQAMSPTMHVTLHEVVANQIWDGEPEVTWQTAERLTGLGYERHEVLHMLATVIGDEIYEGLQGRRWDLDRVTAGFAALPDSWEALRPRGQRRRRGHRRR